MNNLVKCVECDTESHGKREFRRFIGRAPDRPAMLTPWKEWVLTNEAFDSLTGPWVCYTDIENGINCVHYVDPRCSGNAKKMPRCHLCRRVIDESEPCLLISRDATACFACYYAKRVDTLTRWLLLSHAVGEQHSDGIREIGGLVWTQCLQVLVAMQLDRRYNDSVRGGTGDDKKKGTVYPLHKLVHLKLHRFYRTGFVIFDARADATVCCALIIYRVAGGPHRYERVSWENDQWCIIIPNHRNTIGPFDHLMNFILLYHTCPGDSHRIVLPYIGLCTLLNDVHTPRLDQWFEKQSH